MEGESLIVCLRTDWTLDWLLPVGRGGSRSDQRKGRWISRLPGERTGIQYCRRRERRSRYAVAADWRWTRRYRKTWGWDQNRERTHCLQEIGTAELRETGRCLQQRVSGQCCRSFRALGSEQGQTSLRLSELDLELRLLRLSGCQLGCSHLEYVTPR